MFSIDTLRATPDSDGATTYDIAIRLTPDILKATMPHYAAYIDKYISKGKYRITLTDKSGARWFDARAANYYMRFKMRSKGGHFAPLEGAVTPMPESLAIHIDLSMKILIFTVGWTDMTGDFDVIDTPHERGWSMLFAKEPEWHLPPTVGYLLKSPLRRPQKISNCRSAQPIEESENPALLHDQRPSSVENRLRAWIVSYRYPHRNPWILEWPSQRRLE